MFISAKTMPIQYIVDAEKDASMKNISPKEAIEVLKDMKIETPLPKAAVTQRKRNAAIEMAIDVLRCSENPNSSDAISRRELQDKFEKWQKTEDYSNGEWNLLVDVLSVITSMPPAPQLSTNLAEVGTDAVSRKAVKELAYSQIRSMYCGVALK